MKMTNSDKYRKLNAENFICKLIILVLFCGLSIVGLASVINKYQYYEDLSLVNFTVPKGVSEIGEKAFHGCQNLRTVIVPEGVTSIGKKAFAYCPRLESITLPKSLETLGFAVFEDCINLKTIKMTGSGAFKVVDGMLLTSDGKTLMVGRCGNNVIVPNGVTEIYEAAFYGRTVTALTLPKTLSVIEDYALCCDKLEKLYFLGNAPQFRIRFKEGGYISTAFCTYDGNGGSWSWREDEYWDDNKLIVYVNRGSTGWNCNIPGDWEIDYGFGGGAWHYKIAYIENSSGEVVGFDSSYGPFVQGETVAIETGLIGYTAKGLPSGLKYDKKTGKITGSAKKPTGDEGSTVTFTKKGEDTETITIVVEKEKMSVACAGLAAGDFRVGVAGGADGIPLEISTQSGIKSVKATKLPTGMKLAKDKKTGEWTITGSPTKAGVYNVVLTVTAVSGATESVTIPVTVAALPEWVSGTFGGMIGKFVDTEWDAFRPYGMITMKITTKGKITAKITAGGKSYSFSGTGFESVDENEDYYFKLATKKGEIYEGVIAKSYHDVATMVKGGFDDEPDGTFTMADGRSYLAGVWRNEHGKDGRLSTDASGKAKKVMDAIKSLKSVSLAEFDSNYGSVKITLDTKGNVKFAGKMSDGFKVSGSTFLMLDDDCYHVIADMAFYDKKSGNVYSIRPCWQPIFDQQGNVAGFDNECCDHSLRIYPFE